MMSCLSRRFGKVEQVCVCVFGGRFSRCHRTVAVYTETVFRNECRRFTAHRLRAGEPEHAP